MYPGGHSVGTIKPVAATLERGGQNQPSLHFLQAVDLVTFSYSPGGQFKGVVILLWPQLLPMVHLSGGNGFLCSAWYPGQ